MRTLALFAVEVARTVSFIVGEYGGVIIDKLTGVDYARREAEIKADIIRAAEGL